jgi:diguanylate cyclase (GGDEF)-like protein
MDAADSARATRAAAVSPRRLALAAVGVGVAGILLRRGAWARRATGLEAELQVTRAQLREARRLANLDPLTSLQNRRSFEAALERELARAQRYGRGLALLLLDLDDFKQVNDSRGHLAGDALLRELGEQLLAAVRTGDVAARVGGDEFAVLLPESGAEDALAVYERFEDALGRRSGVDAVSVSAGVSSLQPGDTARGLFGRADEELYRTKHRGKAARAASAEVWP